VALAVTMATLVTACGDDDDPGGAGPEAPGADAGLSGALVVFAAASLTDVFTNLGDAFTDAHPGVSVTFNFAASSELATQIEEGAPVDVFASADQSNMAKAVDAGAVTGEPVVFARNRLQIVVEEGNPEGVAGLADLGDGDLVVSMCAPEVPCGRYAAQAFEAAGLPRPEASQEQNVRAVVARIALGEADAGIGYTTDVLARADEVDGVDIPDDQNVVAEYPVAELDLGENPAAAAAWVAFLGTPEAVEVLTAAGFLAP
jgi:molybdate transport system substrate-binding protein